VLGVANVTTRPWRQEVQLKSLFSYMPSGLMLWTLIDLDTSLRDLKFVP